MSNGRTVTYDVVILGGGPAGIVGAATAAALGGSVAIVDNHAELGGAGVNTGTVPSKTLRETALALSGMRSRNLYGVDLSLRREANVGDFLRHEQSVKTGLNTLLAERLEASRADVHRGTGTFGDEHTVRVPEARAGDEVCLQAKHILIATGSSPIRPAMFPFDAEGIYDSDTILGLQHLPRKMAIIGGGVIGSEYACTFAALDTHVHLIDGRNVLLPFLDRELSRTLAAAMERNGVEFHWNERATACVADGPGRFKLSLLSGESLEVDTVLVAAGRRSNTGSLNLPVTGVRVDERGLIRVDEHFQTEVPHIYAAGDVIGFPALASTSMLQARVAMRHAFGQEADSRALRLLPTGVYTIPEAGTVGKTEEALQQEGADYVVGRAPYSANARGRIVGDVDGFLKLLFERPSLKLAGVHVIGEQATELVHIGLMGMLTGVTADLFADTCFNIPTLGELFKLASLDAISRLRTGRSLVDLPALRSGFEASA